MSATAASPSFRRRVLDWTGNIVRSPLFWGVLTLKVVVSAIAGSTYLTGLFMPFVGSFVQHPLTNPYEAFWNAGLHANFPYPALMLFVEGLPHLVLRAVGLGDVGLRAGSCSTGFRCWPPIWRSS